jgi:imidazolonepropionase-like amidohydrolase
MKSLLVSMVLTLGATGALAADTYVIRNARIVTVSGPTIENGSVVVSNGKIAAAGADVVAPPGASVLDATGKTVYPGMIDALTKLGLREIELVQASVDTTEVGDINPQAKAWVALNPHSELLPVARANGVLAALSAPEGGLISGQGALIRLTGTTPDAMTVKAPTALLMAYPSGNPSTEASAAGEHKPDELPLRKREEEKKRNVDRDLARLRNLFENAKAYGAALESAGKGEPPKPDPVLEALAPFARGAAPLILRADNEEEIRGAVAFASERGLRPIVAGGLEAWRCAPLLKEKDVTVLLKVLRLPRKRSDPYDAAYANAAILHQAGVRFAIVTDDDEFVRNLPYEAAMARAFGLPPDAALRAITLSPAEILGVADRLGSIEPGKDANLVVATGDIMDHRTEVTHVFIDGVPQSLETRHTRLYEQFKNRP